MRTTMNAILRCRILLNVLLCTLASVGAATVVEGWDPSQGLVAYWPMEGNAVDRTAHGNDGTVIGAVPAPGKFGQAFQFDGVDDEIVVSATPGLADVTAGPHSYSAWVLLTREMRPYPYAAFVIDALDPTIPYPNNDGDQRGLRFGESSAPCFKWVTTTQSYFLFASTEISLFEWHHIAGVYDGSRGRVYVDGVLSGEMASTGAPTRAPVWKIGNISGGGTGLGFFPGLIDEVRVYGRAISESEVAILSRGLWAKAGSDRAVDEGTVGVALDGSQSAGTDLTFAWRLVAPGSPEVSIVDPAAAIASFDAPYVGANTTLTFELTVTNANLDTDSDTVDITLVSVNDPPVSDAGDDLTIKEGAPATLDGTHSYDPNNDEPLSYSWRQVAGPSVSLDNASAPSPGFMVPAVSGQSLVFQLVVSDGRESGAPDLVQVRVVENAAPLAHAGDDQTKNEGAAVALSGLRSFDPDGDGLSYWWQQVSGTLVDLSDRTSPTPTFTAPFVGSGGDQLVFRLVVTDNDPVNPRSSQPDDVVVSVVNINDPPRCNLGQASVSVLWPPNHKMTSVTVEGVSDPDSKASQITLTLLGVTQDEPVNGLGDGDTSPDAVLVQDGQSVLVRSERAGGGNGRVYRITFRASDGSESCTGVASVSVPHSRKDTAVDDAQPFDSTQP